MKHIRNTGKFPSMQGGEFKKGTIMPHNAKQRRCPKLAVLTELCLAIDIHSPNERALFTVYHSIGVKRCQNLADIIQIMVQIHILAKCFGFCSRD